MIEDEIHFPRNPIVEASLSIEINELDPPGLSALESLTDELAPDYPVREDLRAASFSFQLGGEATKEERPWGYLFRSVDGKQVVQARLNGFTFSRLAPYDRWEPFLAEARRTWAIFTHNGTPALPASYAVRFINKLPIPSGEPIQNYLRTYPEVAREMPQLFSTLYLRMDFPLPENGLYTMQQTVVPSDREDLVGYILDNDFRFPAAGLDEKQLWSRIDALRKTKNDFFVGCITEAMMERLR